MRVVTMCCRSLLRRRVRTSLTILGIALSVMLVTGIGLTTENYITTIKEMNIFYQGKIVIAGGGGGIPVIINGNGLFQGVEAVS